jgi:hypothetical protein
VTSCHLFLILGFLFPGSGLAGCSLTEPSTYNGFTLALPARSCSQGLTCICKAPADSGPALLPNPGALSPHNPGLSLLLSPSLTMPGSRASTASASAAVSAARPRQHQKSMSASVHPNKASGLPPTESNCEVPRPRQVCWGS